VDDVFDHAPLGDGAEKWPLLDWTGGALRGEVFRAAAEFFVRDLVRRQ
jgi:hypothetical protein